MMIAPPHIALCFQEGPLWLKTGLKEKHMLVDLGFGRVMDWLSNIFSPEWFSLVLTLQWLLL
jgi:hypothetical protein